jgi:DNA modification methylase
MACFVKGDIHTVIKDIESGSVDLIYTNPPFGTTCAIWDKPLNWHQLFPEMWRVLKPNGSIVLHASMPFSYDLIRVEKPKYHYSWIKDNATCFMLAKRQPLRKHEEVLVWYKRQPVYNPQMVGDEWHPEGRRKGGQYYGSRLKGKDEAGEDWKQRGHKGRYPTTILDYKRAIKGDSTRPEELVDYFIKTYSNEGEKVLDLTCYNGLTGKRCVALGRRYLGVDLRPHGDWFRIKKR